jgi:hypothetical protein
MFSNSIEHKENFTKRSLSVANRLRDAVKVNKNKNPVIEPVQSSVRISQDENITSFTGIAVALKIINNCGLPEEINGKLNLLKINKPYLESDHILSIVLNVLCGGKTLDDIDLIRKDTSFLNSINASSLPAPTTAGDFCRRFTAPDVELLMDSINKCRINVWKKTQNEDFFKIAICDIDGTLANTDGRCKERMDINYKGDWGYHPLVISFASTGEILFIMNREGSSVSHEDAEIWIEKCAKMLFEAGFKRVQFRGDTDFSLTSYFDYWTSKGIEFVYGYDAKPSLVEIAQAIPKDDWESFERCGKNVDNNVTRQNQENHKRNRVIDREYSRKTTVKEEFIEFPYSPDKCKETYNMVALKKKIDVYKGDKIIESEDKYFFYITNDPNLNPLEVIKNSNDRCNQENTIGDVKKGTNCFYLPMNTFESNWVWMVCTALAWSVKAWFAFFLNIQEKKISSDDKIIFWPEKSNKPTTSELILKMEFKKFLNNFIKLRSKMLLGVKKIYYEVVEYNEYLFSFVSLFNALE